METKEIIKEMLAFSGLTAAAFAKSVGMVPTQIYDLRDGRTKSITFTTAKKIVASYPAVNIDWLLTGEGEMLRPEASGPSAPSAEVPHADEPHRVPLIPGVAKGGTLGEYADPVRRSECGLIVTPVPAAELAITVSGESMEPDYPAGSVALLRRIDEASFIEWGRAYVLDTVNGAVLKLLAPSDREGHVRCLSINPSPAFAPFDVPLPDIHGIYRVLACIIFH